MRITASVLPFSISLSRKSFLIHCEISPDCAMLVLSVSRAFAHLFLLMRIL